MPAYKGCDFSVKQTVLLLMRMFIFHKQSYRGLKNNLEMLTLILPKDNNVPKTVYKLQKFFSKLLAKVFLCFMFVNCMYNLLFSREMYHFPLLSIIIHYYPLFITIIHYYPLLSFIIIYYPLLSLKFIIL